MSPAPQSFLPLAPAAFHILMSLADQERHGYAIMQEVARSSEGQYRIGPGTLYENLQKLLAQELIVEVGRRDPADLRRRYYRLTAQGRSVAMAEISRLEKIFRHAKTHLRPVKARET